MKIICENCGAKYSIADEKVKGKVFKIRCKKCQESIVIRGDAQIEETASQEPVVSPVQTEEAAIAPQEDSESGDVETKVFDYSGYQGSDNSDEAVWHISTDDGEQQGPYSAGQIAEYVAAGSLTHETFVWREGFGDWLPIKEVEDLLRAITASGASTPEPRVAPVAAAAMAGGGGLFDAAPSPADDSGGGLFDAAPPTTDSGGGLFDAAPPAAGSGGLFDSAPSTANAGGDLFTTPSDNSTDSPGFAGGGLFSDNKEKASDVNDGLFATSAPASSGDLFAEGGDDDGVFASTDSAASSPRVSAEDAMMTGQRSENSVLFSLSNLQALASSGGSSTAADAGNTVDNFGPTSGGAATPAFGEEASGLIDIRSMAASLNAESTDGTVDDLLSLGGGGFAPTLGAPVLAAAPRDGMSLGMKIGLIGGGVVLLAVLVVLGVFVLQPEEKDNSAQNQQIAILMAELEKIKNAGGNQAAQDELLKKIAQQESSKIEPENQETDQAKVAEKTVDSNKSSKAKSSSSKRKSSRAKSKSSSTSSSTSDVTPDPKPRKKVDELDDLLGGSTRTSKKKKKAKKASTGESSSGSVPDKLSKSQVMAGMNAVRGSVKRCGQGQSGSVTVKAVISSTGRVSSANTTGAFAGTPAGLCAARAVRRAKFPKTKNQLTVRYPFKF